jgi:drug/metabolite transporter (DMT)-like permease
MDSDFETSHASAFSSHGYSNCVLGRHCPAGGCGHGHIWRPFKRVPASQAGIFVNLEPLVGAILGVSLLHEDLGIMALAGGALIIVGAMYFSYKPEGSSEQPTYESPLAQ